MDTRSLSDGVSRGEQFHESHPSSPAVATVRSLLATAGRLLRPTSPTPRLDTEILLAHVLAWPRSRLIAETDYVPDVPQVEMFFHLVDRRARHEPVAYLVHQREFFGFELFVDERVLIPRPETELLVERVLAWARARMTALSDDAPPCVLADIGTGSGAIAIALALNLPPAFSQIYATDISAEALAVAATNLARHRVEDRVTLREGDLLTPLPPAGDCLVANLPYLAPGRAEPGVSRYEPALALDGGPDGLALYRRLIAQSPRWLRPGGALFLEIEPHQASEMAALIHVAFPTVSLTLHRDLAGHKRVVEAHIEVSQSQK
jgi:release factor glutamine methyltransferase